MSRMAIGGTLSDVIAKRYILLDIRIFGVFLLHVISITGGGGESDYASNSMMGVGARYTEPSPGL